ANFMNTDATSAAQFEQQGYDNLKNGKYEDAYKDFIAANNSSFNFNGVYKIAQSLADLKKQTGSWEIPAEKVKTSLTFLLNSNAIDLKYKNLF
ncbi:MAG: hypothetical protein JWO06_2885, partial [Bacteroidota bacterium]|nr:hypothetical protein [Bacteroidota bacterium]